MGVSSSGDERLGAHQNGDLNGPICGLFGAKTGNGNVKSSSNRRDKCDLSARSNFTEVSVGRVRPFTDDDVTSDCARGRGVED